MPETRVTFHTYLIDSQQSCDADLSIVQMRKLRPGNPKHSARGCAARKEPRESNQITALSPLAGPTQWGFGQSQHHHLALLLSQVAFLLPSEALSRTPSHWPALHAGREWYQQKGLQAR